MNRRTLDGKRAIVTGASSGIGRELALELARQGVSLIVVARRAEKLSELQAAIANSSAPSAGPQNAAVHVVAGDVAEPVTREAAIACARDRLGGLDLLINNAGISAHGRFEDASRERLRTIMEVNFFAAVELTRDALPVLRKGREPAVVNIGSILGRRAMPFNADYCASKFALAGWSEAIRPELARHGIDVVLVNPGTTRTEFFEHLIEKTGETPWRKQRGATASDVARATIAALQCRRAEVVVGTSGKLLLWLNRLAPRWVDRYVRRYG
jgi:short-subunit dehydrogenase